MGSDQSSPIDEAVPPQTLEARNVDGLGTYIKSGRVRNIVVMSGAGISTSAGIPDFRSPETGLYANLQRLNLPHAEAVFDISYFRQNPEPFYALAKELYPGKFRPTIAHSFIRLLHDKGLLMKHFTQNIDCLDREAGVPEDHIVEAHGSFAKQSCIECQQAFPKEEMLEFVEKMQVPHCKSCNGLVKPEIVFFGEALPPEFFANRSLPSSADLCIILGTSLTVQPFASLPMWASEGTPRVLINLERVGGIGSRPDDILLLGDCDEGVRKLAAACGWLNELEQLWSKTRPALVSDLMDQEESVASSTKTKDEIVQDEVEILTRDIDKSLQLSQDHEKGVRSDPSMVQRVGSHLEGKISPEQLAKAQERAAKAEAQDSSIQSPGTSSLSHVFPHLGKKPAL